MVSVHNNEIPTATQVHPPVTTQVHLPTIHSHPTVSTQAFPPVTTQGYPPPTTPLHPPSYTSQYQSQYPTSHQYPENLSPQYGSTYLPTYGESVNNNDDNLAITVFNDKSVRRGFIRKVFAILFIQLLITMGIMCIFMFIPAVNQYTRRNAAMFWTAWVATLVTMFAIACCDNLRRSFPLNIIVLLLFTICEGYLLGIVSAHYQVKEVLIAVGVVAFLTLSISLITLTTKLDFTLMIGSLFVFLHILICFGFLAIFFHNKILRLVYACFGALLFGLYLMLDIQLMVGGTKRYAIDPEEYVFAALNLYVDIVTMFLLILQLVGIARD